MMFAGEDTGAIVGEASTDVNVGGTRIGNAGNSMGVSTRFSPKDRRTGDLVAVLIGVFIRSTNGSFAVSDPADNPTITHEANPRRTREDAARLLTLRDALRFMLIVPLPRLNL